TMMRAVDDHPDHASVGLVYSDHDLLRPDGRCTSPVYKPELSPERLRNHNYITHLVAVRRSVLTELGGVRSGFDGAQDHDLLLRLIERNTAVVHVPEVLAHWRQSERSVATDPSNKPDAYDSGVRAVQEHLDRTGTAAVVAPGAWPGTYRIHRRVHGRPTVSIVIPSAGAVGTVWGGRRRFVDAAIASIESGATDRCAREYVVVLDTSADASVRRHLDALAPGRVHVVEYDAPFNFADKVNRGVAAAAGDFVLILNDDTELIEPGSIDEMVGLAQLDDVGMVGARLLFDDGTIQHAGHVYNQHIDHAFVGWSGDHPGPHRLLAVEREVGGVTAAAAMLRRSVYDEVGGMSLEYPANYNDVDLSLRVRASGRRIVWTPHACWYHFESRTRAGTEHHAVSVPEIETLLATWGDALWDDPYYNPNLADGRADWLERPGRSGAPPYVVLDDGRVSWA
ncbi:MAG: glycosyltransferase, partial [Actinomycetota bacterium]